MAEDEIDLSEFEEYSPTAKKARGGRGGGRPRSRTRRWPWLVVGLVVGAVAAVLGPELAAPYLPDALRLGAEEVPGHVVGKRISGERLLLTVDTDRGAILATFRQRVPELDLLVEPGDSVTLGLDGYAPLVEDPALLGVRKSGDDGGLQPASDTSAPTGADPDADEAPTGEGGEPASPGSGGEEPSDSADSTRTPSGARG